MISGTARTLQCGSARRLGCTGRIHCPVAVPRHVNPLRSPRHRVITAFTTDIDSRPIVPVTSVADPEHVQQGTPLRTADLKSHYDSIVVGSGMGGLTAAVGLAKFGGQQVLVLEQHYTAGGFTHAFWRDKYVADTHDDNVAHHIVLMLPVPPPLQVLSSMLSSMNTSVCCLGPFFSFFQRLVLVFMQFATSGANLMIKCMGCINCIA